MHCSMPFYVKDWSICRFWYPWGRRQAGGSGINHLGILRDEVFKESR